MKFSINPLTTNVPHHIETSQLICIANQLTGFYMKGTLVVNGLRIASVNVTKFVGNCGFVHIF